MSILFMGGEVGAFIPSDSAGRETTNTFYGGIDTAFSRACLDIPGVSSIISYFETAHWTGVADTWLHISANLSCYSGYNSTIRCYNGATEVVRVSTGQVNTTSNNIKVEAWDGSAWQLADAPITIPSQGGSPGSQVLDLRVDTNTGTVSLYVAGTRRIHDTGMTLTAPEYARLHATGFVTQYSQIIVADEPTIGWRLLARHANGAGATGDWIGGYTDIDEAAYSDADFVNSATNGQIELFTQTGPTIAGYVVRAVGVSARAKCGVGGPQNIALGLRVSGTNYFGATQALDVGYGAFIEVWEQNPATSADWLNTSIDAIQFGVKALT